MIQAIKALTVWMLMLCLAICLGAKAEAADEIIIVKVSGTAVAGQEAKAIEDAKKRAVFKVFSHDTRAENDPNSAFAQMMNRYNDYVDSCKVVKKSTSGNQLMVIAEVAVRDKKLHVDFQELVAQRKEKNDDMTANIVIRAVNTSDNQGYGDSLEQAFNHRFGMQGFQVEQDEDLLPAKQRFLTGDYNSYIQSMWTLLDNNTIMVNYAIVGEAKILGIMANPAGKGYMARAGVKIQAYDCRRKTIVGEFKESYEMLAETQQEAERLVLTKAGLDSAEKVARDTINYWIKLAHPSGGENEGL